MREGVCTPIVSIVVPVYNDEKYIKSCLDSIINQSYTDIEVICIDDYSQDNSIRIIKEIAKEDIRIKHISLESNQGAFIARKRGVELAIGDYILFVDADDYIDVGLIEEILEIEENNKYDILHFSSDIINYGVSEQRIREMQSFTRPLYVNLYNGDIFRRCYCTEEYGFNIWNKLFKTDLCKEVFSMLPDLIIPKANDAFIYYFLSANAHSYRGYKTKSAYHYCFGNGNTGERNISKAGFDRYCHYNSLIHFMSQCNILKLEDKIKDYALDKLKRRFIQDSLETWLFQVREEEKADTLPLLIKSWDIVDLVENIFEIYRVFVNIFSKYIIKGNILESHQIRSKKIAIYYYKYRNGGIEKVISLLISLYLKGGYDIVLITEEEPTEEDYNLPEQVKRYTLTRRADVLSGKAKYRERASRLIDILKEEQVDILCYHAAANELLFYDLLITKYMGVKFIVTKHEIYSQDMSCNQDSLSREIEVFPLVDALTVLSEEEKLFWRAFGVKSLLIENPMQPMSYRKKIYNEHSKDIVWVGRLDRDQKQYQDIVPIIEKVVEKIPEAKARIYGSPDTYKDEYLLKKQIEVAGMEANIKYVGFTKELNDIYENAGVVLITSAYEAFSTVILESKQFGIPVVTYSMPYLELLKDKKGFREVEQGDIDSAAKNIIELLCNKKLRLQLSLEAKESVQKYSNLKIMDKWDQIFLNQKVEADVCSEQKNEYKNIIKSMIFHHSLGYKKYREMKSKYMEVSSRFKQEQIKRTMIERNLKLALYPYGVQGMKLHKQFEMEGIKVSLLIDNKWKGRKNDIISVDDLKEYSVQEYLFVICSENVKFYQEIRKEIYSAVPKENIYDWYPLDAD